MNEMPSTVETQDTGDTVLYSLVLLLCTHQLFLYWLFGIICRYSVLYYLTAEGSSAHQQAPIRPISSGLDQRQCCWWLRKHSAKGKGCLMARQSRENTQNIMSTKLIYFIWTVI